MLEVWFYIFEQSDLISANSLLEPEAEHPLEIYILNVTISSDYH